MGRPRKDPQSLVDTVMEIDPIFAKEVNKMDAAKLKEELFRMAKYRVEIEEARALDTDLAAAKEKTKELGKTYTEPLKAIKLKSKLAVEFLKSLSVPTESK